MFFKVCIGEITKQRLNYFNSISTYISLLIWPILTIITCIYSYKSFDIEPLKIYGINSRNDLSVFIITGFLCFNCFFTMVQSGLFMHSERENGTLETVFLSPAPRLAIMYGRALGALFQSTWIILLYSVVLFLLEKEKIIITIIKLPLVYLIIIISSTIWGGLINAIFTLSRDIGFWFTLCEDPMKFLSGVSMPISVIPVCIRWLSVIFPLTFCLDLIRGIIIYEDELSVSACIKYIIVNLIVVAITILILRKGEINNRETGNLQLY
ncbi:ABC-2 type transport system permease protein [Pseudobutyrivibrio sp. UC1225]|uniref:ABC transporter permease n=1 Tax=Pseudobutyrivibrio sp. UC1225 TaxID=1798185 RepID=UPI0008DED17C|nr:ABC transporter permease [Pseudobutyrivibrio sp. UC1225]SFO30734.1 ABC-2 type transport system permease protein [Pseudobutyrivibrio sp. UC1225]